MKRIFTLIGLTFLLVGCMERELICEEGILEDDMCKITLIHDVKYRCSEGYKEDKKKNKCVNTLVVQAKQVSTCPDGYEIGNDYWCYSKEKFDKEKVKQCISKNIKKDDKLSSTYEKEDVCYEKICIKVSEDGKECLEYKENKIDYLEEENCPKGSYSIKGECRKKYWMDKEVSCQVGELKDDKCIIYDEIDLEPYCNEGYKLNNNKCEKTTYVDPIIKDVKK